MNPRYRFIIKNNGVNRITCPIYGDDLSKDYSQESGQMFFRTKLDGKLKFVKEDYDYIMAMAFDAAVYITVEMSVNGGKSWSTYFNGKFMRTDCTIIPDDRTLEVSLSPDDAYETLLAGLEKEFNLIELSPEILNVGMAKRPALQVYAAGDSVVTSFIGNTYFEQESSVITNDSTLKNTYKFANCGYVREFSIYADNTGTSVDENVMGTYVGFQKDSTILWSSSLNQVYTKFGDPDIQLEITSGSSSTIYFKVRRLSTDTIIAANAMAIGSSGYGSGEKYILLANSGVNSYYISYIQTSLYTRVLSNASSISNITMYDIPSSDIVENNMNYKKVYPYSTQAFAISTGFSSKPTEYGIIQPGKYFTKPNGYTGYTLLPVSRSQWVNASIWCYPENDYLSIDTPNRQYYNLRHAYTIESCIRVLLEQIDPKIYFTNSKFLIQHGNGCNNINPVSSLAFKVLVTHKTNILKGEYDQPAQKLMITLKHILDMLKNCFQCYWFLEEGDDGYYLKIEHISYFQNGLKYPGWDGAANVGIDTTMKLHPRSGKPWCYGTSEFSFDKEDMPSWYQFEWADDVTFPFKGHPIEVVSNYVKKDNIETISVSKFSSDVDLMLLNPSSFSEDGLALLVATQDNLLSNTANFNFGEQETSPAITLKKVITTKSYITIKGYSYVGNVMYHVKFLDSKDKYLGWSNYSDTLLSLGGSFTITGLAPEGTAKIVVGCRNAYEDYPAGRGYLSSVENENSLSLPIISKTIDGIEYVMQNGYAAFCDLQERYYMKSMPASKIIVNKIQKTVIPKRGKKQEIEIPTGTSDPNIYSLIRTSLGDGQVKDMKINLSSRLAKVTLMHDTEK